MDNIVVAGVPLFLQDAEALEIKKSSLEVM